MTIDADAGTFLWMIATDTYPDYDGLTIYTTKRASAAPQQTWPDLTVELLLQVTSPHPATAVPLVCVHTCMNKHAWVFTNMLTSTCSLYRSGLLYHQIAFDIF